jgi:outer membrane lipoprotein-sorting protein
MNRLDRTLELFGTREPDADMVDAAQRRLDAAVAAKSAARPARPVRAARGWLAAGASALVAAVAMLWLPLGTAPALAFAQVQQHFRDFQTLRFDLEQRMNGNPLMKARVSVRRDGSVRTEVGDDVVVVVNSSEMRVLTLVKASRMAVVSPLDQGAKKEDALKWLDDIRNFQGVAKALPGSRIIRGQRAQGWALEIAGGNIELWANDAGLPLEMSLEQGMQLEMTFDFRFDLELPEDLFSTQVPDGYRLGGEED